ncbi:MAG: hypothetical protein CM15mP9_2690 [Methanobacteriota archaeon]|nr:MAG: hypothetical protein CM15mP9_2690 [Euryarchaeota archaeon]
MADYGPWKMVLVDRVPLAVELMSPDDERVVFLHCEDSFPTNVKSGTWKLTTERFRS